MIHNASCGEGFVPEQDISKPSDLLSAFLNVYWLRPEAALFLAISAYVLRTATHRPLLKPSLDVGAGNGLFSFLAAGGEFSEEYDVYLQAGKLESFWNAGDIYDHVRPVGDRKLIARRPGYAYNCGFDHKENLKLQSDFLDFYADFKIGDANASWPFAENSQKSVFSNIGYWLESPGHFFSEIGRILEKGGKSFIALQAPSFLEYCPSYNAAKFPKLQASLELLNRGRAECAKWRLDLSQLAELASRSGMKLVYSRYYLSEIVLRIWDIGLRPFSPALISMANSLSSKDRVKIKREWVQTAEKLLAPIFESEKDVTDRGGYLYLILEKV